MPVPSYTGYDDRKSVADILALLANYKLDAGALDDYVLTRALPVAFQAGAALWWRIVAPFITREDFRRKFFRPYCPTFPPPEAPALTHTNCIHVKPRFMLSLFTTLSLKKKKKINEHLLFGTTLGNDKWRLRLLQREIRSG